MRLKQIERYLNELTLTLQVPVTKCGRLSACLLSDKLVVKNPGSLKCLVSYDEGSMKSLVSSKFVYKTKEPASATDVTGSIRVHWTGFSSKAHHR